MANSSIQDTEYIEKIPVGGSKKQAFLRETGENFVEIQQLAVNPYFIGVSLVYKGCLFNYCM